MPSDIDASRMPVVASHVAAAAVSGAGGVEFAFLTTARNATHRQTGAAAISGPGESP